MSRNTIAVTLCLLLTLAACGGGGNETATEPVPAAPTEPGATPAEFVCTPPPEGVQPPSAGPFAVGGTTAGRSNPSFILLGRRDVFDEEARVLIYGADLAVSSTIGGWVLAGNGYWCSSPDPTAYNGLDRGTTERRVYLRTTVDVAAPSLSGTLRDASGSHALSGGPLPGVATGYSFLQPADPAALIGAWQLADPRGNVVALDFTGDGRIDGSVGACQVDGQIEATAPASGAFKLTLAARSSRCLVGEGSYTGTVLAYPLAAGGRQMALFAEWTNGFDYATIVAVGRR